MKKLLIVLSALVVVVLAAAPVFAVESAAMYDPEARQSKLMEEKAAPVKVAGELTFGAITPFDADDARQGYANMYADFYIYADEYNTIMVELDGGYIQEFVALGAQGNFDEGGVFINGISANYWRLDTDVGKALDLPIGLVNTAGKTSLYSTKYEVTGLAYERDPVRTGLDPIPWTFAADAGMFQLTLGLGFGTWAPVIGAIVPGEDARQLGIYLAVPELGPAFFEAWYMAANKDYKGRLGADAKVMGLANGMVDVAGGFVYDVRDDAERTSTDFFGTTSVSPEWAYGIGVNLNFPDVMSGADVGVGLNGNDTDAANQFGIDGQLMIDDTYGLDAAVGMSFADGADTFQGAEFSVFAQVGAAKWSVGYTITENGFAYVPAVGGPNGGLFVNADIDF